MAAYYNEYEPYAAQWLRNLIGKKLIADGVVDERTITTVSADDVRGFAQCHFFAGIGGWSYAARLAGWPDDRELWTGSPPCQPYSVAGKKKKQADARHLWPDLFRLIAECRPPVVMGEQVTEAVSAHWFDRVRYDFSYAGYACDGAIIPGCAVNAPHKRSRLFFVADRYEQRTQIPITGQQEKPTDPEPSGDSNTYGTWDNFAWVRCHDGRQRRIKPGLRMLADGFPSSVGRVRAYGNAVIPQVAAQVIGAYMDCRP